MAFDLASASTEDMCAAAVWLASHFPADTRVAELPARLAFTPIPDAPVRVVFGGHFSCGKSTLLNALIGRQLLPSSMFPETGVACWLMSGSEDSAVAVTDSGPVPLALDRRAIAREVSLLDGEQNYRDHIASVHRVEIALRDFDAPPDTVWLDSPGVNDPRGSDDRALETAETADLLCWVVPSHHAFSLTEQYLVQNFVERHTTAGLAFLVNVFLDNDEEACWNEFVAGPDARGIRNRIDRMMAEVRGDSDQPIPPVVFVSARAGLRVNSDHFGLPQVRNLLGNAGHGSNWIIASRLARVANTIEYAIETVQTLAVAERERVGLARDAYAADIERRERTDARFRHDVRCIVESAFAAALAEIDELRTALVAEIDAEPFRRGGTYGDILTDHLAEITSALSAGILRDVSSRAMALQLTPVDPETQTAICKRLDAGKVDIRVPQSATAAGTAAGVAAGALAGAAVGSVIPIFGTIVGGIWGGIMGGATGEAISEGSATSRDREATRANTRVAVQNAQDKLSRKLDKVVAKLIRGCHPTTTRLPAPDLSRLASIEHFLDRAVPDRVEALRTAARRLSAGIELTAGSPPMSSRPMTRHRSAGGWS